MFGAREGFGAAVGRASIWPDVPCLVSRSFVGRLLTSSALDFLSWPVVDIGHGGGIAFQRRPTGLSCH